MILSYFITSRGSVIQHTYHITHVSDILQGEEILEKNHSLYAQSSSYTSYNFIIFKIGITNELIDILELLG